MGRKSITYTVEVYHNEWVVVASRISRGEAIVTYKTLSKDVGCRVLERTIETNILVISE